ncbi:hypothetical protein AAJP47_03570 [Psychrobacter sp. B38]|uniref:hypothetical protein n=1 Tax=Psychrobacter sp. B38 TaxID=3143538 RepID=UPI00320D0BF9
MVSYFWEMIKIETLVNGIALLIVVWLFSKIKGYLGKAPLLFKSCQRLFRKKTLIRIKDNRHDDRHYLYELQKSQNWFITFSFVIIINFLFLLVNGILNSSIWLFLVLMTPSFIIEIIWLNKVSYVEDLRIYQKDNLEWKKRKKRKNERRNKNNMGNLNDSEI